MASFVAEMAFNSGTASVDMTTLSFRVPFVALDARDRSRPATIRQPGFFVAEFQGGFCNVKLV